MYLPIWQNVFCPNGKMYLWADCSKWLLLLRCCPALEARVIHSCLRHSDSTVLFLFLKVTPATQGWLFLHLCNIFHQFWTFSPALGPCVCHCTVAMLEIYLRLSNCPISWQCNPTTIANSVSRILALSSYSVRGVTWAFMPIYRDFEHWL